MTVEAASRRDSARLAACVQAIEAFLDEQLEALAGAARDSLRARVRDAADADEEERLVSVLEEVEVLAPQAGEALRAAILSTLTGSGDGPRGPADGADDSDIALVETAKVDDWLRLRNVLQSYSDETRAREDALCARLSRVSGVAFGPEECPVSLLGVCVLFQGVMRELGAAREVRHAVYDAFEGSVLATLHTLVASLEDIVGVDASSDAAPPRPRAEDVDDAAAPVPSPRALGPHGGDGAERPDAAARAEGEPSAAAPARGQGASDDAHDASVAALADSLREAFAQAGVDEAVRSRLSGMAPALARLVLEDDFDLAFQAARHDPVTGLLDGATFLARLESAVDGARGVAGVAVCLVEVDGFREIGQRLGVQVAGRLLRTLGDLLRKHAGGSGQAARLRGAQLGIFLPAPGPGAGRRFATRFLAAVNGARFGLGGQDVAVRLSIAVVEPDCALTSSRDVMRMLQATCDAARRAGGNCVRVYEDAAPG